MKVFLLEKERFELRGQLIENLLIIKQLKTTSKNNTFTTDSLLRQIRLLLQLEPMITAIMIIAATTRTTASTTISAKTRKTKQQQQK